MKVAIMQPYSFPYLGYFQLINLVDVFVFYDDVNYMKQGWVNRNNILVNGRPLMFTIPLEKPSSFIKIHETKTNKKMWELWKKKFLRTLDQNYKKAPFYDCGIAIVDKVLSGSMDDVTISKIAIKSVIEVCNYLDIDTKIVPSSSIYKNDDLSGKDRVVDICIKENATHYINPIGGQVLYKKPYFKLKNIKLNFIQPSKIEYKQFNEQFVPWLSIIDVIMFNSKEKVKESLTKFQLV